MFGLLDLISVLRYRPIIIIWAFVVATGVASLVGTLLPEKYESVAVVQVDSIRRNDLTGRFEPRVKVGEFLGQQAALAGSRTVALAVIDDLTVTGDLQLSDFEQQWRNQTGGEVVAGNDLRLWAADRLISNMTIKANALESTLAISYRAPDPSEAARIANGFANAYIDTVLRERQTRFARTANDLSQETKALADEVSMAQRKLADYRNESGILPIGSERVEAAELEYAAVAERLAEARADYAEARSLLDLARSAPRNQIVSLPIPTFDQSILQAQARLGQAIARLNTIFDQYGVNYPGYDQALKDKQDLEDAVVAAIRDRASYARQRVTSLETDAEQLRRAVSNVQSTRDAYQLLENRLTASQETFNLVSTRSLQESLQSRVDPIQVVLLARAVPRTRPATPPLWMVTALGAIFGLGMGVTAAVAFELFEGRIRSEVAISHLLRTKTLGVVSMPTSKKATRRIKKQRPTFRRRSAA